MKNGSLSYQSIRLKKEQDVPVKIKTNNVNIYDLPLSHIAGIVLRRENVHFSFSVAFVFFSLKAYCDKLSLTLRIVANNSEIGLSLHFNSRPLQERVNAWLRYSKPFPTKDFLN